MNSGLGLRDMFEIGLAHLWKALAAGLIAAAALAYLLFSAPPVYETRSLLLVQMGREYVYVPDTALSGARAPDPGDLVPFVNAEMQLLDSATLRNALLDALLKSGVFTLSETSDRKSLYDRLDSSITLNLITGSYIVDLRVRDGDPATALAIASTMVDVYLSLRGGQVGMESPAFLSDQIIRTDEKIAEIDGQTSALAPSGLAGFDRSLADTRDLQSRTAQELAAVSVDVAGFAARVAELATASADFPADSPATDRARTLLAEARAELATATARQGALTQKAEEQSDAVANLMQRANRIDSLRRAREAETAWAAQLQLRLRESEATADRAASGFGTVRVLDKATLRPSAVGLPDRIIQIASGLAGLIVAALVVVLAELRARGLYSGGLVQARLGLPVLAEVEHRRTLSRRLGR